MSSNPITPTPVSGSSAGADALSGKRPLILAAKRVYRAIPFLWLRALLFNSFLRIVRRRHVQSTVDGLSFAFDLGEMIDVGLYLGEFEPDVVRAIEHYCQRGWTVLDIGANIGAHTFRIARAVGETGHVFAFEPTSYAHSKLVRNLSLNHFRNITVEKAALSNVRSEDVLLRIKASWRTDGGSTTREEPIRLVRLDDWCVRNAVTRIDLIKLDVDGGEFSVLEGGEASIGKSRPVFLIEAGLWHFKDAMKNPFRRLESLGYVFTNARTGKRYLHYEEIQKDCMNVDSINLIALVDPPPGPGTR